MAQTIGKHYVGDDEGDGDVGDDDDEGCGGVDDNRHENDEGKLAMCAQESPSTSFIVLDPKDLKELGRWETMMILNIDNFGW